MSIRPIADTLRMLQGGLFLDTCSEQLADLATPDGTAHWDGKCWTRGPADYRGAPTTVTGGAGC